MTLLAWCVAWLLDVIIGDPQNWPHPVRWIGNLINAVQRGIRHCCHSDAALRIGGGVMWLAVVGLTWGVAWGVLALGRIVHPWLGWAIEVWMIFTVLAGRSLANAARDVQRPLQAGDLDESREKLSWIVGARYLSASAGTDQPGGGGDRRGEHGRRHYRPAVFPSAGRCAAGDGL